MGEIMVYSTENFYKTFEAVRKRMPYKICIKAINPEEILLRSNLKDLNETSTFIGAYEAVTHSHFKIVSNKSALCSPVCRRKWICSHSLVSGMSEKCPASIKILIKKINKHNTMKDAFLRRDPPHPAVIKINPNHNHPLMIPLAPYKLLKVNNGVKECFYEYFKRGYHGARAKWLHEHYLQKVNFYTFGDESMNPGLPAIFELYNNWLKMTGNMQVNAVSDNGNFRTFQISNVQQDGDYEVGQSSQNIEKFLNMEDVISKLKKEPDDATENITDEVVADIKPVLNIKQEIVDEDENDKLPIISSYGSIVAASLPALPPQPILTSTTKTRTAKMAMQNVAAVVKMLHPSPSQVVVYDHSTNTYKVVKCLAVDAGTYSGSLSKSYLPSTLLPSRISLQKL